MCVYKSELENVNILWLLKFCWLTSGKRVSGSSQPQVVFYIVVVLHFKKDVYGIFVWVNTLTVASMFSKEMNHALTMLFDSITCEYISVIYIWTKVMAYVSSLKLWCLRDLHIHINDVQGSGWMK